MSILHLSPVRFQAINPKFDLVRVVTAKKPGFNFCLFCIMVGYL